MMLVILVSCHARQSWRRRRIVLHLQGHDRASIKAAEAKHGRS